MTVPMYLMLAAAVLSALAWRWNATSAALAFGYFACQGWYLVAGTVDVGALFMIDIVVVALVFCKAIARCPEVEFRDWRHQLQCMVAAFTPGDRIVLAIFPAAWCVYVLRIDGLSRWWLLWGFAMLQFAAAGLEAFNEWRRCRAPREEPDAPPSGMMFAAAGSERWST